MLLLNPLGMCVSFLLLCQYEREKEGDIAGLVKEASLVLLITILWPMGIFV